MTRSPTILLLLPLVLAGCRPPPPCRCAAPLRPLAPVPELELVESVPLETTWDQPDLREAGEVWREMIRGAKSTLDLAQFYIANKQGEALEAVIVALEQAAGRGVRVRVMVERKFLMESRQTLDRLAGSKGVQAAVFDLGPATGGILHAKYFIVDGREVFLGSQNFDWRALSHIHELGVRVRDAEVALTLGRIFEADWARFTGGGGGPAAAAPSPDSDGDGLPDALDPRPRQATWARRPGPVHRLYLVASPPAATPAGIPLAAEHLPRLLDEAAQSISAQLLTYDVVSYSGQRWTLVDEALRRAAARGVSVRLNISHWSKGPRIRALLDLARVPGVQIKINTIPPFSGGFIPYARVDHCKYLVVDGKVGWVGTSNWSGDYFTASRNVELIFDAPAQVSRIQRIFEQGWSGPYAAPLDPAMEQEKVRKE